MYECMMATGWQIKAVRNKPHGVIAAVIYSTASAIAKAKAKPEAKAVRHATTHSWWWCMDVARGVWVLPWGKGRGGGMVQGRTGVSTQMDARTHLASWRGQEHSEKQVESIFLHITDLRYI